MNHMPTARRFTRTVQNFTCEACGTSVIGNGYTNHCPNCLTSKHVDVNPGDRASNCLGVMDPVGVEFRGGKTIITHVCRACGYTHPTRSVPADNSEAIIRLSVGEALPDDLAESFLLS